MYRNLRLLLLAGWIWWISSAFAAFPGAIGAAPSLDAATEQVQAHVLLPVTSVQPGQSLRLGFRLRLAPHWHTYWLNPGDAGQATRVKWFLPAGASAEPLQWPTPQRVLTGTGAGSAIVQYGYDEEVVLLARLGVPADVPAGSAFRFEAEVTWLVCNEVCIPETVRLAGSLPVKMEAPAASDEAKELAQAEQLLPPASPWKAHWQLATGAGSAQAVGALQLLLEPVPGRSWPAHDQAWFFPAIPGTVDHGADQRLLPAKPGQAWRLQLEPGEQPPGADTPVNGVLVFMKAGKPVQAVGFGVLQDGPPPVEALVANGRVDGGVDGGSAQAAPDASAAGVASVVWADLWPTLLLALVGGAILNLMPCVFPVLSIKALALLQSSQADAGLVRRQGLAYSLGVVLSFLALAVVLLVLRAGGEQVGWGLQFQSPVFVFLLALLLFVLGLSLSGVLLIGASASSLGGEIAESSGLGGSFLTGVLAVVAATPCTAPFMGAAMGYAITQPGAVTLAVFAMLGWGMALPFLLLCYWPALQQRLPRPGAWMETLKQLLAFPMYASAAWLAWVLTRQSGPQALAILQAAALLLALAAWWRGKTQFSTSGRNALISGWLALALAAVAVLGGASLLLRLAPTSAATAASGTVAKVSGQPNDSTEGWQPYSAQTLQSLRQQGQAVFVNLTADWCITCLVNERVALDQAEVEAAFRQAGVARLKGDWTRADPAITRLLAEHGRSGVPLYLFWPAGAPADSAPQVLPQILTPGLLLKMLGQ